MAQIKRTTRTAKRKPTTRKKTTRSSSPKRSATTRRPASKRSASTKKVRSKTTNKKSDINQALAIVALILNILILPGLGTLIGGKIREGVWQVVLAVVGGLLSLILIGIPIVIAAWIWGIVSGVKLIKESQN